MQRQPCDSDWFVEKPFPLQNLFFHKLLQHAQATILYFDTPRILLQAGFFMLAVQPRQLDRNSAEPSIFCASQHSRLFWPKNDAIHPDIIRSLGRTSTLSLLRCSYGAQVGFQGSLAKSRCFQAACSTLLSSLAEDRSLLMRRGGKNTDLANSTKYGLSLQNSLS